MSDKFIQVFRAKVADSAVRDLLAVHPAAVSEAKSLCPALVQAELVEVGGGTWLHVLTWTAPDGEEQLMAHAAKFESIHTMHAHLEDAELIGRGRVAASD